MQVWQLQEPFWETITSLSELLSQKVFPFGTKEKSDFYEIWQQHKQLKIMEINETWPDIFYDGYIHQIQSEPTKKIH